MLKQQWTFTQGTLQNEYILRLASNFSFLKLWTKNVLDYIFLYDKNDTLPPTASFIYSETSFKDCSLASYCNLSAFIKQKMRLFRSLSIWKSARRKKISTYNKII